MQVSIPLMDPIYSGVSHGDDALTFALNDEQRSLFMEVIADSLRLQNRSHLFNWLQRAFQGLIAHEVVILGVRNVGSDSYDFEYLTSSRYFGDTQFEQVLQVPDGLVAEAFTRLSKLGLPVFYDTELPSSVNKHYAVEQISAERMLASELKRFVVHGFGDAHSGIATVVMFGRIHAPPSAYCAHLLELLMPHLHCAIVKVTASKSPSVLATSHNVKIKPLSKREMQVLEWLPTGKTNWEIAQIMQVSPLTVKNHVQNILRKLHVENRNQAASKALKLGMISKKSQT